MTLAKMAGYDTHFVDCDKATVTCNDASKHHKHCDLCGKAFNNDYKRRRHFNQSHASRALAVDGVLCFPCRLPHDGKSRKHAHYHCPLCDNTVINRRRFIKHIKTHERIARRRASAANLLRLEEPETNNPEAEEEFLSAKRMQEKIKECRLCRKEMDSHSIRRHLRDVHGEGLATSICVDEARGIFMLRKSSRGGVSFPVHVQKCVSDPLSSKVFCEDKRCGVLLDAALKSGRSVVECRHLQQVGDESERKKPVELPENNLLDLSLYGPYKMLEDDHMQECLSLSKAAASDNAELIVSFPDGEKFIHFSVYHGKICSYSKLGRVIVTCNLACGTLDCACCCRKRLCVHKAVCLWYLCVEGMIDSSNAQYVLGAGGLTHKGDSLSSKISKAVYGVDESVDSPVDENVIEDFSNEPEDITFDSSASSNHICEVFPNKNATMHNLITTDSSQHDSHLSEGHSLKSAAVQPKAFQTILVIHVD